MCLWAGVCCTEIENWTDSAKITNMIETCLRYCRNLIREGGDLGFKVKYETKVPNREMKCCTVNFV